MTTTTINVELAKDALKELRKAYAKHMNWHAKVDAYIASGRTIELKGQPPTKAHKHQMYWTATRVVMILDLDKGLDAGQSLRPNTLGEIGTLIQIAEVTLAKL
jgi:hypothetical protein